MSYLPAKGKCFLIPSGPLEDGKHLFVIVTNKCPADCHLLISRSSVEPGEYYDPACLLQAGDHPFIKHLSFVVYSKALIISHDDIIARVRDFTFLIKEDVSDTVAVKIRDGIAQSKRSTKKIKAYFGATHSL
jgi:hypothetical protein